MNTGKTVGMAIIVVAIVPIILGMVWPTDTETVDTWEVQPGIDVTGDLANRQIDVYDAYTGPLNNLSIWNGTDDALVFPEPAATTDVPNSYPVSTILATGTSPSVTVESMITSGHARVGLGSSVGFSVNGVGSYSYGDYWPNTNVLVLYDSETKPVMTLTPELSDVIAPASGVLTVIAFEAPTGYMDPNEGITGLPGLGVNAPYVWMNGLHNRSVELWAKITHTPFSSSFRIDALTLTWNGMLTVTDGQKTEDLGSAYDYVRIVLDDQGKATVTGLIGVSGFLDRTYTLGNSIELQSSGNVDAIPMQGAYVRWWMVSTTSAIASTTGMSDSALSPEGYYGAHAWQLTIVNPSTFGTSLDIAGGSVDLSYPITAGSITIPDGEDGEKRVAIRGLKVLSLVLEGTQHIYIDGTEVASTTPASFTVTFAGQWYTSVVLAKVLQDTHDEYRWTAGVFGFDQAAYCLVGLMSCVCVGIAGSLWGRRTGESVLALHITMILCGIAYLVLL